MRRDHKMKTIWNYSWAAVAMLAALASCQKENDQAAGETLPSAPEKGRVTLTASIPAEGLTKVSFTEADNGSGKMRLTKLSWEADDVITVNGNEFTVKEGSISEDGLSATFQGEDPGNGPYNIAYTSAPDDLNNQTQPADGDAGNLGYSVSLTGADAYEEVAFTSAWAGSHGAAFAQSSVLQLRATLPAAVASAVQRVVFKSSAAIFNGRDSLTVKLTTPGTAGEDNKLDIYAMLPAGDVTLAEDMDLLVQFQVSDKAYDKYTAFRHFASGTPFIQSGATQYLGLNCSNIASYANASTTSIGTSANPYLIGDRYQLAAISGELSTTEVKHFKLVDDITVSGWSSIDCDNKGTINLNGNNKTISGLKSPIFSFFDGKVSDLVLSNATLEKSDSYWGVLARTIEKDNCLINNVSVKNSSVSAVGYVGGLIGRITATSLCEMTGCSTDVVVSGSGYFTGGLVGYVENGIFTNCSATGNVTNTKDNYSHAGGLIGGIKNGTVNYCHYATGTVASSAIKAGGLIGNIYGGTVNVSNCYFNGTVGSSHERIGGLIGNIEASSTAIITDCYSSGSVNGVSSNYCGGFLGYIESSASITVTHGFTNCSISGGKWSACVFSAGNSAKTYTNLSCTGFVGWNTSNRVAWCYNVSTPPAGNYMGKDGSIYSQAVTLGGWDFTNVWTTDATPQLRPYVAPAE